MARTQVAISTDLAGDLFTISVWDVATGNVLTSYKSANGLTVPSHCIDIVRDHYLMCTYTASPTLNVWNLAKRDHLYSKMVLPGVVAALTVSSDGAYCLAAIDSKIYIWQISSGHLLNVLERHYQKVVVLRISNDLSRFISAGEDGLVLLWDFARCIVEVDAFAVTEGTSSQFEPFKTIHNSSARINDLHLSDMGVAGKGHFAVASEDNGCRIYSLESGQLLVTLLLDAPVRSVVMDRSERFLFCGLATGDIVQTALADWEAVPCLGTSDKVIDLTSFEAAMEAAEANDGSSSVTSFTISRLKHQHQQLPESAKARTNTFSGHSGPVTCLTVSIDGHGLVSGSADKNIKLWHIKSRQCMRTMAFKGAISNILLTPSPNGLFVYDSLEAQAALMEPTAQVATDVSLRSSNQTSSNNRSGYKQSSSSSSSYKVPLFDQSKYTSGSGRPTTYEAMIKRAANPPPPIVPFKREIYRPGGSKGGSTWKAFEQGVVMVANDDTSGARQFWPWDNWTMPSEEDIEDIFQLRTSTFSTSNRPHLSIEAKGGKSRKGGKRAKLSNGHSNGEVNGEDEEDDDDETEEEVQTKNEQISQLKAQNDKLFHYAMDQIFVSAMTGQPSG